MKFAAIDIGSNAVRLQISALLNGHLVPVYKKVEYVRFPLRLGQDVFDRGVIGPEAYAKFLKLMEAYKLLMDLFEVEDYVACATSAMRSSDNGQALVAEVARTTGIRIQIIDGDQEAAFISLALMDSLPEGYCLHIDVGGGSTELNLYLNRAKIAARSFALGSVRNLNKKDSAQEWDLLEDWVDAHTGEIDDKIVALGTGGNISKLFSMSGKKPGQRLSLRKLQELRSFIGRHSLDERIQKLQLNPDRADVILPASDLYLTIMRWAGCTSILVPNVGLKDGLLRHLYRQRQDQAAIDKK
ncbi:Ppx/GppA phosphatase family protein [Cesiribacter andamanensis]|uniref:Exopolyphosphatase n=1 Tax=Cesiribacter andamanensis AMV16 TaxID=1279009 RepID=M7NBM2_9BACT|nr:exopolyphosphatase [Cesiribacter andamanensis]EMR04586.1 Exopolyphosphatase [Cesiribacter andamanensis AMV16]